MATGGALSQDIPRIEEDQCTREANEDDGSRPDLSGELGYGLTSFDEGRKV